MKTQLAGAARRSALACGPAPHHHEPLAWQLLHRGGQDVHAFVGQEPGHRQQVPGLDARHRLSVGAEVGPMGRIEHFGLDPPVTGQPGRTVAEFASTSVARAAMGPIPPSQRSAEEVLDRSQRRGVSAQVVIGLIEPAGGVVDVEESASCPSNAMGPPRGAAQDEIGVDVRGGEDRGVEAEGPGGGIGVGGRRAGAEWSSLRMRLNSGKVGSGS